MFSEGIERDQWHKIGQTKSENPYELHNPVV